MTAKRGGAGRRGAAPQPGGEDRPAAWVDPVAGQPPPRRPAGGQAASSDPAGVARDICLRLLSVRPRTRAELDTALRRCGLAEEVIAEVLDRYSEVGMIDDEVFARAWVTSRHHGRGLARRALAGELRRKGVAQEAVGTALGDLDPGTEEATARAMVERRLRTEWAALRQASRAGQRGNRPGRGGSAGRADAALGAADGYPVTGAGGDDAVFTAGGDEDPDGQACRQVHAALVRRLVGMLARKGYPPGLAYRVVKEALAANADASEAADLLDLDTPIEEPDDFDQLRS